MLRLLHFSIGHCNVNCLPLAINKELLGVSEKKYQFSVEQPHDLVERLHVFGALFLIHTRVFLSFLPPAL